MPASIAYHTRSRQRPFRVVGSQLSPRVVTSLPTRSAVGTRPVFSDHRPRSTWKIPFFGGVMTPRNRHEAHRVSASAVTVTPAVNGIRIGVQQPVAKSNHHPVDLCIPGVEQVELNDGVRVVEHSVAAPVPVPGSATRIRPVPARTRRPAHRRFRRPRQADVDHGFRRQPGADVDPLSTIAVGGAAALLVHHPRPHGPASPKSAPPRFGSARFRLRGGRGVDPRQSSAVSSGAASR